MSTFSGDVAERAQMTFEEIKEAVLKKILTGELVLPANPDERDEALKMAILQVMNERYEEVERNTQ